MSNDMDYYEHNLERNIGSCPDSQTELQLLNVSLDNIVLDEIHLLLKIGGCPVKNMVTYVTNKDSMTHVRHLFGNIITYTMTSKWKDLPNETLLLICMLLYIMSPVKC
ncbi:unnamed protein product [Owenia fusiformis]|uniref:Uncharacterized protein n=1 Tax=Owenia fusiformis TaxID=6347 RepID=A0A8S4Q4W5_OWEFU|nr:unnamed protein product [Owenia fusiformis]